MAAAIATLNAVFFGLMFFRASADLWSMYVFQDIHQSPEVVSFTMTVLLCVVSE